MRKFGTKAVQVVFLCGCLFVSLPGWCEDTASATSKPDSKMIEAIEGRIASFAADKGFTTSRDDQGRMVVKDKDGKLVPLPPGILPPPPPGMEPPPFPPEVVAEIEKRIASFATTKGYTTARDAQGRMIVKDKDGKQVDLPKDIFPPPPGFKDGPVADIEKLLKDYLEKNKDKGYTSETDPQGRTHIKDKDGKDVTMDIIKESASSGTASSTSEVASSTSSTASETTSTATSTGEESTSSTVSDPNSAATK